jgi:hypothetical protein
MNPTARGDKSKSSRAGLSGVGQCAELYSAFGWRFKEWWRRLWYSESWWSNNLAQRIHRSASPLQTARFSGVRLNLAIASHSAANLRKRSDVFTGKPSASIGDLINRIARPLNSSTRQREIFRPAFPKTAISYSRHQAWVAIDPKRYRRGYSGVMMISTAASGPGSFRITAKF